MAFLVSAISWRLVLSSGCLHQVLTQFMCYFFHFIFLFISFFTVLFIFPNRVLWLLHFSGCICLFISFYKFWENFHIYIEHTCMINILYKYVMYILQIHNEHFFQCATNLLYIRNEHFSDICWTFLNVKWISF